MAKAKEVVKTVIKDVETTVKVELVSFVKGATHTIYHRLGSTMFEDGTAEVSPEVAKELKEIGQVK